MLVIFETLEKEWLKVDLEHVPSKGEAVTVFDTVYQVGNVMYETTIRIKPSGKRSVKQIATCEISPIVLGDFQVDKQDDKWEELKMEEIYTDNTKTLQNALDKISELEQQIENWKRLGGGKHEKEQIEGK